ncbi:MAG: GNAT family N-acetyltransferase [Lachnospiraceae bacterium]|nr:GNAT family N-acetyltransferase [Lachnospiraceae bacterium]
MKICRVSPEDAAALLDIYAPYVLNTAITFEYTVPELGEFRDRIITISAKYPYIKAVDDDGSVLGYAYAAPFHKRKACEWAVETSVYIRSDAKRRGIGSMLYAELEGSLKRMGILNMNASIAEPNGEDEYLTCDSIHFHEKYGFSLAGRIHDAGHKFGHWYNLLWMEKSIGEHTMDTYDVRFGQWKLTDEL